MALWKRLSPPSQLLFSFLLEGSPEAAQPHSHCLGSPSPITDLLMGFFASTLAAFQWIPYSETMLIFLELKPVHDITLMKRLEWLPKALCLGGFQVPRDIISVDPSSLSSCNTPSTQAYVRQIAGCCTC